MQFLAKKTFPESRITTNIDKLRLMKGYKAIKRYKND